MKETGKGSSFMVMIPLFLTHFFCFEEHNKIRFLSWLGFGLLEQGLKMISALIIPTVGFEKYNKVWPWEPCKQRISQ
jgi:hypothetical protein